MHMESQFAAAQRPITPDGAPSVAEIVDKVEDLIALPDTAVRLNALLTDPDASTGEIAEVLRLDPALCGRVLRAVNSAYFGLRARVDTIPRAVSIIGTGELHSLVLASSAAQALENISSELVSMQAFWEHSVRAALAARAFAEKTLPRHRERVFLSALMHDVGQLVLCHQLPAESRKCLEAIQSGEPRERIEFAVFGFTHADVGAALLERWRLPESIAEPVRYHHAFDAATKYGKEAALIHLGCKVSHLMEQGPEYGAACTFDVDPEAWTQAACSPEDLEKVTFEVGMHWLKVMEILGPESALIY